MDNALAVGESLFGVTRTAEDEYKTSIHVAQEYMGIIVGQRGATVVQLERETKTEVKIPRRGESGDVVIRGSNFRSVREAREKIEAKVRSAKTNYTHFLSIPVSNAEVVENFNKFKKEVIQEGYRWIDEDVFQMPRELHLTLEVMCLESSEKIERASRILIEAKDQLVVPLLREHGPLKMRIKGLAVMGDDPKKAHVLYGRVQEDNAPAGLFQTIADGIVGHFNQNGLIAEENAVLLHVTLINTLFRRQRQSASGDVRVSQRRIFFDASPFLEKYADFDFGVFSLDDIHLSRWTDIAADGYYVPDCVVSCSES